MDVAADMGGDDRLVTLTAQRVCLRGLTAGDAHDIFAVFSDPQVTRYWSSPPQRDLADAARLIERVHAGHRDRSTFQWGIARRTDDRVIGTCTLARIDRSNRRAEVGFALASAHWRQGLMSEALRRLLAFAFDELHLHRVEADVDPRNDASIHVLERLGFQREGLLRERWLVNGEIADTLLLGLLAADWRARA